MDRTYFVKKTATYLFEIQKLLSLEPELRNTKTKLYSMATKLLYRVFKKSCTKLKSPMGVGVGSDLRWGTHVRNPTVTPL